MHSPVTILLVQNEIFSVEILILHVTLVIGRTLAFQQRNYDSNIRRQCRRYDLLHNDALKTPVVFCCLIHPSNAPLLAVLVLSDGLTFYALPAFQVSWSFITCIHAGIFDHSYDRYAYLILPSWQGTSFEQQLVALDSILCQQAQDNQQALHNHLSQWLDIPL